MSKLKRGAIISTIIAGLWFLACGILLLIYHDSPVMREQIKLPGIIVAGFALFFWPLFLSIVIAVKSRKKDK